MESTHSSREKSSISSRFLSIAQQLANHPNKDLFFSFFAQPIKSRSPQEYEEFKKQGDNVRAMCEGLSFSDKKEKRKLEKRINLECDIAHKCQPTYSFRELDVRVQELWVKKLEEAKIARKKTLAQWPYEHQQTYMAEAIVAFLDEIKPIPSSAFPYPLCLPSFSVPLPRPGEDFYPIITDPSTGKRYMKIGMGLGALLDF